jgi:phosphonate transport system substrate-binding protein
VLSAVEPDLTVRTRIVARSEWLGFPPFVARSDRKDDPVVADCRSRFGCRLSRRP